MTPTADTDVLEQLIERLDEIPKPFKIELPNVVIDADDDGAGYAIWNMETQEWLPGAHCIETDPDAASAEIANAVRASPLMRRT